MQTTKEGLRNNALSLDSKYCPEDSHTTLSDCGLRTVALEDKIGEVSCVSTLCNLRNPCSNHAQ